jgi:hypothetical protein
VIRRANANCKCRPGYVDAYAHKGRGEGTTGFVLPIWGDLSYKGRGDVRRCARFASPVVEGKDTDPRARMPRAYLLADNASADSVTQARQYKPL